MLRTVAQKLDHGLEVDWWSKGFVTLKNVQRSLQSECEAKARLREREVSRARLNNFF